MKTDTVLLDRGTYDDLCDFKRATFAGKKLVVTSFYGKNIDFYTDIEMVKILVEKYNETVEEYEQRIVILKNERQLLYERLSTSLESGEIKDLKLMSYWKWRKWRKNK